MNSSEKTYSIKDWYGRNRVLTAKELYERVLRDSVSDYNWIASATELVKVVNEPDFPPDFKETIQIIILNCFANLEKQRYTYTNGYSEPTDQDAVYDCYYSLPNTSKEGKEAKLKYLTAIVTTITKRYNSTRIFYEEKRYDTICKKWEKLKVKECFSAKEINLETLRAELENDFIQTIESAEKAGIFNEDY